MAAGLAALMAQWHNSSSLAFLFDFPLHGCKMAEVVEDLSFV